jgi:hypothetical protein
MRLPTAFFVAFLCILPSSALAGALLQFQYGEHRYSRGMEHSVVGAELAWRFDNPISLGVSADYLSPDFGGTPSDFTEYRGGFGANYHIPFICLFNFEFVPGLGLEYVHRDRIADESESAVGIYARGALYVRILPGLGLGIQYRGNRNRLEGRGSETAFVARFTL